MEQTNREKRKCRPIWCNSAGEDVIDQEDSHRNKVKTKIYGGRKYIGNRYGQARKIHLAEQMGIGSECRCVIHEGGREKSPDSSAGEIEEDSRNAFGINIGDASEHEGVNQTCDQRTEQKPCGTENCLLIVYCEFTFGKHPDQIAVFPHFLQLQIKQLLSGTDMSIKEVCATCGYTDPNYFSRSFKKNVGVTPTEFKERR